MGDWTKVVTNPLGLAGFVLFLVFGYLAKAKRNDERRWLSPAAIVLAFVALLGGLFIAYKQVPRPSPPAIQTMQPQPPGVQQSNGNVQQSSSGPDSPNVQGVQGNVTITVDQSKGAQTTNSSATKTQSNK